MLLCVAATDPVNVTKKGIVFAPNMGEPISDGTGEWRVGVM